MGGGVKTEGEKERERTKWSERKGRRKNKKNKK